MPQLKVLYTEAVSTGEMTTTTNSAAVSLDGAQTFSVQCNVDVDTPSNKTFASTAVDTSNEHITIAAHGYTTGLKVQISNPGTLPTGILAVTDYFVINFDVDTIMLASTLVLALAGTPINISAQGSGTNTVNVTAIAGASVKLQKSNVQNPGGSDWNDEGSATNITADGLVYLDKVDPTSLYMRVSYTLTAGRMIATNNFVVKGLN